MSRYGYQHQPAGSRASGRPQPGVVALRDWTMARWPAVTDLGIYNDRRVRGRRSYSLHREGRAWDCGIPTGRRATGEAISRFYVDHAADIGCQRVIFWHATWDARTRRWSPYRGVSGHTDHIHAELAWPAARDLTVADLDRLVSVRPEPVDTEEEEMARPVLAKRKGTAPIWLTDETYQHRRGVASLKDLRVLQGLFTLRWGAGAAVVHEFEGDLADMIERIPEIA